MLHPCCLTTPLLPSEELSELGTCSTSSFGLSTTRRHRQLPPRARCYSATTTSLLSHHQLPVPPAAPTSLCTRQRLGCVTSIFWTRFSHQAVVHHSCRAQIALCSPQDGAVSHHLINLFLNHSTCASPKPHLWCGLLTRTGNVTPHSLAKLTGYCSF